MKFKSLLLAIAYLVASPVFAIEGQVVDAEGNAVAGATIEVIGTRTEVITDEQGNFSLDISSATELHVEAAGFAHKSVLIQEGAVDQTQRIVLASTVFEQFDVIGIPLHASNIESAIPVNILAGDELRSKQAATLGDTLANEMGIHTSFHGSVASTPIIRGLSGPRVLITQNSLDVADVSREGPDHSVTAESVTAEQIEVLRGPATLFFGSGAIGGVVNVIDKRVPTDAETYGEWSLSHDSVNDANLATLNVNTGVGDLAFHIDGFWRETNEYEVPVSPEIDEDHGERKVANTEEESDGFTFGSSYLFDSGYVGFSYGRSNRDYGIPGHGHGEEEGHDDDEEEHEEGEEESVTLGLKQDRFQLLSEFELDNKLFSTVKARAGYTDYEHTEFEDGVVGTTFTNETSEVKLELLHKPIAGWHGGLVVDVKNAKFSATGDEAFAPPSETDTFAIAIVEERHFGDVLLQMGARVEQVTIKSNEVTISDVEFHHHDEEHEEDEEDHGDEVFSFDEDYTPFSLSVGAVWDFTPGYNVGVSLSHSERAPSAAELLSYGPHIATGTFEIGAIFEAHEEDDEVHFEAITFKPKMEKSTNIDISFRKYEGDFGLILNAFYNQVDNYYTQFDTELVADVAHGHDDDDDDDADADVPDEEHAHVDELPVFLFQTADVTLKGFEAQGIWQLNSRFKTTVFADYVKAELDGGGYLPRIPPLRFGASLDYVLGPISANLSWARYSDQDDVAELETETDSYDWVTAGVDYRIPLAASELTVFMKVENITDEEARVHSSFLKDIAPRPGRNFRLGVRGTF